MKILRRLSVASLAFAAQAASATIIDYHLVSLGGSSYRYEYKLMNDGSLGAGVPVKWYDITFNSSLYDEPSLLIVTPDPPASDWDEQIFSTGLLVEPVYDVFALSGGIAVGGTVSGFSVQFTWLGAGIPGVQSFEVYDPNTFDLLESGRTQPADGAVPEPGTLALFLPAFLAAAAGAVRRRRR